MSIYDYILILIIGLCLFLAVRYIIRQKKRGKCIGCSECNNCTNCPVEKNCDKRERR